MTDLEKFNNSLQESKDKLRELLDKLHFGELTRIQKDDLYDKIKESKMEFVAKFFDACNYIIDDISSNYIAKQFSPIVFASMAEDIKTSLNRFIESWRLDLNVFDITAYIKKFDEGDINAIVKGDKFCTTNEQKGSMNLFKCGIYGYIIDCISPEIKEHIK